MYALSKDYGKLFDYLCAGNVAVGWVDYSNVRDVVKIQRRKAFDVYFGVRGVCYTDLGAFDQEKGEERDVFAMRCESVGLEWIEPAVPRATVAAAMRELRAKLDSMMFNERHATPFTAIQKAQVELNATIAKLGLADETQEETR